MRGCARVVAWVLTSFAAIWALLAVLMVIYPTIDEETGEPNDAALGGILLTAIFGIPGGIMLWRTGVAGREEKFETELIGFIYSHDRFTVADLARKIGRNEMETESLIQQLNVKRNIGLAFHRSTREYMHYSRMQQQHGLISQCTSCGANIGQQILFPGETVTCPYCNAAVSVQPGQGQPPGPVARPGQGYDVPQPMHQHPGAQQQNPYAPPGQSPPPQGQPAPYGQAPQAYGQPHPHQPQQHGQPQPPHYPPPRPPGSY